jgi:hypothetical protein
MHRLIRVLGLVLAAGCAAPAAPAEPPLADAEFDQLFAAVKPSKGEDDFAKIPWLTSLSEARKMAAKEGKPILLWEMDGHPLGCT